MEQTEAEKVLASIRKVSEEKKALEARTSKPILDNTSAIQEKKEIRNSSSASTQTPELVQTELISSNSEDGTVFLLWWDNEDAKKYDFSTSGIYPMKSAMTVAKYIDYHNEAEKIAALESISTTVELFENDSIEIRNRGRYVIIIGKMVKVEIQKRIIVS